MADDPCRSVTVIEALRANVTAALAAADDLDPDTRAELTCEIQGINMTFALDVAMSQGAPGSLSELLRAHDTHARYQACLTRLSCHSEAAAAVADASAADQSAGSGGRGRGRGGRGRGGRGRGRGRGGRRARTDEEQDEVSDAPLARGASKTATTHKCAECGAVMTIEASRSELICTCGAVEHLDGEVFGDGQFYNQEGQHAKSGGFRPNRHLDTHLQHLYAKEPEEEISSSAPGDEKGDLLVAKLRERARARSITLQLITAEEMRSLLAERTIARTDLNINIPLLMKKVTGVGPPEPNEELTDAIRRIFAEALEHSDNIRRAPGSKRANRDYYPYYIRKIIEAIVPVDNVRDRAVLRFIYMQGDDTLYKDDDDWRRMCACMDNSIIQYKPTRRTDMTLWTAQENAMAASYTGRTAKPAS